MNMKLIKFELEDEDTTSISFMMLSEGAALALQQKLESTDLTFDMLCELNQKREDAYFQDDFDNEGNRIPSVTLIYKEDLYENKIEYREKGLLETPLTKDKNYMWDEKYNLPMPALRGITGDMSSLCYYSQGEEKSPSDLIQPATGKPYPKRLIYLEDKLLDAWDNDGKELSVEAYMRKIIAYNTMKQSGQDIFLELAQQKGVTIIESTPSPA